MIPAERWVTIEPVLDAVLALPPSERGVFLDRACAGDHALRAEIALMVAECTHPDALLQRPAIEQFATLWREPHDDFVRLQAAMADRYTLIREAGRGGMGAVYLARDLRHDRDVAVKVLHGDLLIGSEPARFLREIRVTARLRHPHIVPLFDSGTAADRLYFVAPYVEGGTLRDRLTREGRLDIADAVRMLGEVAGALAYAHTRGVIHCDIKPENILLGEGGAVLGDFGIARAVAHATRDVDAGDPGDTGDDASTAMRTRPEHSRVVRGTPAYMAPEQAFIEVIVDHRVDLYALGVVAYEMLAGCRPSADRSPTELAGRADDRDRATTLVRHRPEIPVALATLVAHLLEPDPGDRVRTAPDVTHALDGLSLPGLPARATSDERRMRRWARWTSVLAMIVVTLAIVTLALVSGNSRAELLTLLTRGPGAMDSRRVVVAPFENLTGNPELDAFGEMAADFITQELTRTEDFEVVDARTALTASMVVDRIPRILRPQDRAIALAEETGAGWVMSGRYYVERDSLHVTVRLTDATDGRLHRSLGPISGAVGNRLALVARVRNEAVAQMGASTDTSVAGIGVGRAALPSYEAYRTMRDAWESYFAADFDGAFGHAAVASSLDTTYMIPLITRAFFHSDLRQWAAVDSLVQQVEPHQGTLPPLELAALDMVRTDLSGDLEATLRAARELYRLTPASAEMATHVAHQAVLVNRPRLALATLDELDPSRGVLLAAPFYWNWRTAALHELGEHASELTAARRGLRQFPGRNATRLNLARALGAVGRGDEIAREAQRATDERWSAEAVKRRMLVEGSRELRAHGYDAAARVLLGRALEPLVTHGDRTSVVTMEERGLLLLEAAQWSAAHAVLQEVLARAPNRLAARGGAGVAAARMGDRAAAIGAFTALGVRAPGAHPRGRDAMWRARIAVALGDRDGALRLVRQALDEGYPMMDGFPATSDAPHVFDYAEPSVHADPSLAELVGDARFGRMLEPRR